MQKSTVLYITWAYTPAHTAGAIRAVNFGDALRKAGFRVIVLTVRCEAGVGRISDDLIVCTVTEDGQLPSEMDTSDLPRWPWWKPIPGPDPSRRSFRAVYQTAHNLIGQYKPDVLFATAPPFSSLVAGHQLAEHYHLPLILEFRDAWFTGMPWPYKNRWQRRSAQHWERLCVDKADRVITVTDTYRRILSDTYGTKVGNKTCTIRHGYDARTFDNEPAPLEIPGGAAEEGCFVITHTGQFQGFDELESQPWRRLGQGIKRIILGSRSCCQLRMDWQCPYYLMAAVAKAAQTNSEFRRQYRLVFVGQKFDQIDRWAQQMHLEHVHQTGPLLPEQALQWMRQSDLLVLLLYGIKNCAYHWCVPSKLYSYLRAGKPILPLTPSGEARDLARQSGLAGKAMPDDISYIARELLIFFRDQQRDPAEREMNWEFVKPFDLKIQQQRFVEQFQSVLD
jgi:glycosyl transferase family 4